MIDLNIGGIGGASHPALATNVPREEVVSEEPTPEEQGIAAMRAMMEPVTLTRGQMLTIVQSIKVMDEKIRALEERLGPPISGVEAVLD
jgi:hypothetical protein